VPRPWAIVWRPVRAAAPAGPTRAAPAITIVPQAAWNPQAPATTLYADDGVAVVTRFTVGRGEVLWWAAATPLTNAGLREPGNLEFVLACLGRPEDGPILFDEYLHGHGGTQAEGVRASSPFGWLLLQGLVLGTAVVLTFSRRSGPVLAAIADTRLSPLEFVQTLGGLYQRAGAASVAVDVCHQRFRYWVSRRLGTPFNLGTEELERVLRERRLFEDPEFRSTLADCEEARKKPRLRPRDALPLVRALYRYAAALHLFDRPGAARRPGRS
jgi:hypothetical protein